MYLIIHFNTHSIIILMHIIILIKGMKLQIYIFNSVRLFVCLFAIRAKTTAQGATKLSGIMKYVSGSVLHGLKSTV